MCDSHVQLPIGMQTNLTQRLSKSRLTYVRKDKKDMLAFVERWVRKDHDQDRFFK